MNRISRRTLIKTSFFGSVALALGSSMCSAETDSVKVNLDCRFLSLRDQQIMYSISAGILKDTLPADKTTARQTLEEMLISMDDYISRLPVGVRAEVSEAFDFLSLAPVRWFLAGIWSSWADADPEDVSDWLDGWRDSSIGMFRSVYFFLQSMTSLAFFDHPVAWKLMGYPDPKYLLESL